MALAVLGEMLTEAEKDIERQSKDPAITLDYVGAVLIAVVIRKVRDRVAAAEAHA